jgi:hypothetical protein
MKLGLNSLYVSPVHLPMWPMAYLSARSLLGHCQSMVFSVLQQGNGLSPVHRSIGPVEMLSRV